MSDTELTMIPISIFFCKQHGARGIMRWAGLINGEVIHHWFNVGTSINHDVCLEILQTVMWPKNSRVSNRKKYWFQQEGDHTSYCCKGQEMAVAKFQRKGHKPF